MRRLRFVFLLFASLLLFFLLQKAAFLVVNHTYGSPLTGADWLSVLWHGLRLDVVTTCYLMAIPLLVLLIAVFVPRMNIRKILTFWYVPVALLSTLAFFADAVLYHFWGAKLDAADLFYALQPKDLFASIAPLLVVAFIVAVVALTWGMAVALRRITPRRVEPIRSRWAWTAVLVLLMGLNFVGMRGGLGRSTANPGYACFSHKGFLNHAALNPLFNIVHSMAKTNDLASEFHFYDEAEMLSITEGIYGVSGECTDTLLCRRPAYVVMVIWEGGGDLMLSDTLVAPCFNRLRQQGVLFDNCYANSFRTDRGLVSLLSGWPALPTASIMKMDGRCAALPSIARSLLGAGYGSAFVYGGDINFTNMRGYLFNTGYGRVEGVDGAASDAAKGSWGVHDEGLLRRSALAWPAAPAMVSYLTLSSHEPWTVPYERLDKERENAFAYTDSCLGAFVADLQRLPVWDSMLLIIVADHGVARKGESLSDVSVAKIPMLWIGGAVAAPRCIDVLMNQSDLPATLLSQMNLPTDEFPFSRNVLGTAYRPLAVHAFKNGLNLIDTAGYSSFDCLDGRVVPSKALHRPDALKQAQALLQLYYTATARL